MIYSTPRFTSTPFPVPDRPREGALRRSYTRQYGIRASMTGFFITQRFRLLAAA